MWITEERRRQCGKSKPVEQEGRRNVDNRRTPTPMWKNRNPYGNIEKESGSLVDAPSIIGIADVLVVVIDLHTGESPDVGPYASEEGLPPAVLRLLRRYVGVHGRESVHPFVDVIVTKHKFTSSVVSVLDWIH